MRNDKLWQMEIYRAMCARRERWRRRRNEVALWLCICNAINVLHEPWTCTIIIRSSFTLIAQQATSTGREETVTSLLLFRIQLFYNPGFVDFSAFFCKFILKQIASHSTKNYFLIHFHFILFTTELFSSLSFWFLIAFQSSFSNNFAWTLTF